MTDNDDLLIYENSKIIKVTKSLTLEIHDLITNTITVVLKSGSC